MPNETVCQQLYGKKKIKPGLIETLVLQLIAFRILSVTKAKTGNKFMIGLVADKENYQYSLAKDELWNTTNPK